MKIIIKIFNALLIINFIIIIIFSALVTFLPEKNKNFAVFFLSSPFYVIPWIIIFILIILYQWVHDLGIKKTFSFIRIHLPLTFLGFAVVISFLTYKTTELSLFEGEKVSIKEICKYIGIENVNNDFIQLEKFKILKYKSNDKFIKSYKSYINIISGKKSFKKIIEVNKPLKINNIFLFQKSWSLGIKEINFSFIDKSYSFNTYKEIEFEPGKKFKMIPKDYDDCIIYFWQIISNSDDSIAEGIVSINDIDPLLKKHNFTINKEDYTLISIIQATYRPFNFLLALAAIIFIFSLIIEFWIINFINSLRLKK